MMNVVVAPIIPSSVSSPGDLPVLANGLSEHLLDIDYFVFHLTSCQWAQLTDAQSGSISALREINETQSCLGKVNTAYLPI
jgi:hypothetical protein